MAWNIGEHRYPQVCTFWKIVEDKDTYATVSISTSRRDKDKVWHNSNWSFVRFVGNAYKGLSELEEKDKIVIKSGTIEREPYVDKNGDKQWPKSEKITVFAWEKYEPENRENNGGGMDTPPKVDDTDEFPF